ncbi:uncharacterized protein LOC134539421 [Bacillus rossius redtenbacheri]|uniref:uncharacterized protein LOC134539421 n=1 Tax=Bacillus rossius redtenbacheri TaxID=93214 RepID=UPI002FDCA41D
METLGNVESENPQFPQEIRQPDSQVSLCQTRQVPPISSTSQSFFAVSTPPIPAATTQIPSGVHVSTAPITSVTFSGNLPANPHPLTQQNLFFPFATNQSYFNPYSQFHSLLTSGQGTPIPTIPTAQIAHPSPPPPPSTQNHPETTLPVTPRAAEYSCYGKIAHPVERLLVGFPETSGLDPDKLIEFIRHLLKIRQKGGIPDKQLLEIVFPYTQPPLSERTSQAIENSYSFDKYHEEILNFFIPGRLLTNYRLEWYNRLQRSNEALPHYVASIREAAAVLRLGVSESEIVSCIVDGLNQAERSRAVFQARPRSFVELDQLCIQAMSYEYADTQRNRSAKSVDKHDSQAETANSFPYTKQQNSHPQQKTNYYRNNKYNSNKNIQQQTTFCNYCKQTGHYIEQCNHKNFKPNFNKAKNA